MYIYVVVQLLILWQLFLCQLARAAKGRQGFQCWLGSRCGRIARRVQQLRLEPQAETQLLLAVESQ